MNAAVQDLLNRGLRAVGPAVAGGVVLIGLILITIARFEPEPVTSDPLGDSIPQQLDQSTSTTLALGTEQSPSTLSQLEAVARPTTSSIPPTSTPPTSAATTTPTQPTSTSSSTTTTTTEPTSTSSSTTTTTTAPTSSSSSSTTSTTEPTTTTTTTVITLPTSISIPDPTVPQPDAP